jgi:hypothetical protein
MSLLITLVKGFAGKPSHPPLTDASIGAYTVGVAMLIAGAAGLEQEAMAKGALLAISGGLIAAIPTVLTGLLDYFDLPKRTAARALATDHLFDAMTVLGRPAAHHSIRHVEAEVDRRRARERQRADQRVDPSLAPGDPRAGRHIRPIDLHHLPGPIAGPLCHALAAGRPQLRHPPAARSTDPT